MLLAADRARLLARARQQPVDRFSRHQSARRHADDLGVKRLADRQPDLGGIEVGEAAAQPCLRLRHVRRRHVAALETRLGGGERLAQGRHIDALGLDQALVGEHVGIGGHRIEQYALAGVAQRLAPRLHLRLRLANGVGGLEAVEQGLRHGETDCPGAQRLGLNGVVEKQHPHLLQAAGQGEQELRAVSRKRLRDAFVGPALARAFGIELRIVLIGAHQRFGKRLGARGSRQCQPEDRNERC